MASEYELAMLEEVLDNLTNDEGFRKKVIDSRMKPVVPKRNVTFSNRNATLSNGNATLSNGNTTLANGNTTLSNGTTPFSNGNTTFYNGNASLSNGATAFANGNSNAGGYDIMSTNASAILDGIDWSIPDIDFQKYDENAPSSEMVETHNSVPGCFTPFQENENHDRVQRDSCRMSMLLRNNEEEVLNYVLGNNIKIRPTTNTLPVATSRPDHTIVNIEPVPSTKSRLDENWRDSLESAAFASKITRFELWMNNGQDVSHEDSTTSVHDVSECSSDTGCASLPSTTLGSPNMPHDSGFIETTVSSPSLTDAANVTTSARKMASLDVSATTSDMVMLQDDVNVSNIATEFQTSDLMPQPPVSNPKSLEQNTLTNCSSSKPYKGEKIFPPNTIVTRVSIPGLDLRYKSAAPPAVPITSPTGSLEPSSSTHSNLSILLDGGNLRHIDSSSSTTPDTHTSSFTCLASSPSSIDSITVDSPLDEKQTVPSNDALPCQQKCTEASPRQPLINGASPSNGIGNAQEYSRSSVLGLDPNELTASQEDLSRKHREAVEARKTEQALELKERQRLEEILELCAEYQRDNDDATIEADHGSLESRGSMRKIKTNGSLGYVSPSVPRRQEHFQYGSTSSTSDDDRHKAGTESGTSGTKPVVPITPVIVAVSSPRSVTKSPKMGIEGKTFRWDDAMYPLFPNDSVQEQDVDRHLKALINDKAMLLKHLSSLKQRVQEIESQQTEAMRELEMERALLEGEHNMEMSELQLDQERIAALKQKQWELIDLAALEREQELERMETEKKRLYDLELNLHDISERLDVCVQGEEEALVNEYHVMRDRVEAQRRLFDDLEFQQLEVETKYEQEREVVQSELWREQTELLNKYKYREEKLQEIDQQQHDMLQQAKQEIEDLELQRHRLLEEFRREKMKLATTEKRVKELLRLCAAIKNNNNTDDSSSLLSEPEREKHNTSLGSNTSSLNEELIQKVKAENVLRIDERKLSADLERVERNRLIMLDEQGNDVIEKERDRLDTLKKKAAIEGRVEWEERKVRESVSKSTNSLESASSSAASSSETPSDRVTSVSSADDAVAYLAEFEKLSSLEKIRILEDKVQLREAEMIALQNERQKREELERCLAEERTKREEIIQTEIKLRSQQSKQARPLTRYLPMTGRDFDLVKHIESAGHSIDLCDYVNVTSHSCHGYLHKMGNKFKIWQKRWFVFDKQKRIVSYFNDKSETKARGIIYFQSLMDVYVDHLRTVKSPSPKLTFCVKTMDRTYFLVAPSAEAMRIWIDVLFTGAEGYSQFTLEATNNHV